MPRRTCIFIRRSDGPDSEAPSVCRGAPILEINSLGDAESREAYETALRHFFHAVRGDLSSLSAKRLERGAVLRILDSKDKGDQEILKSDGFPRLQESLTDSCRKRFEDVLRCLDSLGISYTHNEQLVRGLDYYTQTTFEFVEDGPMRQAVLAGGRYEVGVLLLNMVSVDTFSIMPIPFCRRLPYHQCTFRSVALDGPQELKGFLRCYPIP